MSATITAADVAAAAAGIEGQIVRTPTLHSRTLSTLTGADIHLKFENQQYTASFKDRGSLWRLLQLDEGERARGVLAASAGNHAQGVALAAQTLGCSAVIVMPVTTPQIKINAVKGFRGVRVVLHGDSYSEAQEHAAKLMAQEQRTFVHPYDDPAVIAGQGTIGM